MKRRLICYMLAVVVTFSQVMRVGATREEELRVEQEQTNNNLNEAYTTIESLEAQKEALSAEINELDQELVNVMVSVNVLEQDIAKKETAITETKEDLVVAEEQKDNQYQAMKKRIQYLYEKGGDSAWVQILLESKGITDLLNKAEYTQEMYEYDRESLQKFEDTVKDVKALGVQLEGEKAELEDMKVEQEAQQASLETQLEDKRAASADYESQIATAQEQAEEYATLLQQQSEEIAVLEAERLAEEEEARRQAEEAAAAEEAARKAEEARLAQEAEEEARRQEEEAAQEAEEAAQETEEAAQETEEAAQETEEAAQETEEAAQETEEAAQETEATAQDAEASVQSAETADSGSDVSLDSDDGTGYTDSSEDIDEESTGAWDVGTETEDTGTDTDTAVESAEDDTGDGTEDDTSYYGTDTTYTDGDDTVQTDEYGNVIDSDTEETDPSAYVSTGSSMGQEVVNYALQFVGNPYVWGGTDLVNGADCSGFVQSVYAHFGVSLNRTSEAQMSDGVSVPYSEAQPGDLICYGSHIAIYIGNGQIVHASNSAPYPAGGIKVSDNAAYRTILDVRRVI